MHSHIHGDDVRQTILYLIVIALGLLAGFVLGAASQRTHAENPEVHRTTGPRPREL